MRYKSDKKKDLIQSAMEQYYLENGKSGSVREIERLTGISHATVQRYMAELTEEGRLYRLGEKYITKRQKLTADDLCSVAVLGTVPCGPLSEEIEEIEGYIELPKALTGKGEFYMLTAQGESMIGAGIDDGDWVIIRRQDQAKYGDIIVALVDNTVTLKTYLYDQEKKVPYLHPENESMSDIYVDDLSIQGIAVRVIKNIEQ